MNESLEIVSADKLLHVKASGKLTKESYETVRTAGGSANPGTRQVTDLV